MKKMLTNQRAALYHYADGARVEGANKNMRGDCSGLIGNCTGMRGDLDSCELTDYERALGVEISDLVG